MSFSYVADVYFFCFNGSATTDNYTYCHTLSLHDALPICLEEVLFLLEVEDFAHPRERVFGAGVEGLEADLFAAAVGAVVRVRADVHLAALVIEDDQIGRAHV